MTTRYRPTIHMNGTTPGILASDLADAAAALRVAIETLNEAAPNGRDFYPQGEDAINGAGDEHRERIAKLTDVLKDIEELRLHVYDQSRKRA